MEYIEPGISGLVRQLRRWFHRHPERGFQEVKTARKIAEVLQDWGIEHHTGIGKTGVVAILKSGTDGPCVGLRADMDALPITEETGLSFASEHEGMMHACGHDAHTAIMLGVLKNLKDKGFEQSGRGSVAAVFQPAEENGPGAKAMLETGFFEPLNIRAMFAGHVDPAYHTGQISVTAGPVHAAVTSIRVAMKGPGGHGAYPHNAPDPVAAAAYMITQLQTVVSRGVNPLHPAVLTIAQIHAGTAENIIPTSCEMVGTIRYFDPAAREVILTTVEKIGRAVETVFGVEVAVSLKDGYPALHNHETLACFCRTTAASVLGEASVKKGVPSMGAEDFSYFAAQWPSIMLGLGCTPPDSGMNVDLHSASFIMDEGVLDTGVALFTALVQKSLEKPEEAWG